MTLDPRPASPGTYVPSRNRSAPLELCCRSSLAIPTTSARGLFQRSEQTRGAAPAHPAQPILPQVEPLERLELVGVGVGDVREVRAEQHLAGLAELAQPWLEP